MRLDVGAIGDGFHGEAGVNGGARGEAPEAQELSDAARVAIVAGMEAAGAGARIGDISAAVQALAESRGYSVVRKYVGHGIGRRMHEEPSVPNFGKPGRGMLLKKGMALAIEPMLNVGTWRTRQLEDNWTVVTADGSLSAHFEHTIAITEDGPMILTQL